MDTKLNKEIAVIKTQISKAVSAAQSLVIETKDDLPKAVDLLSKIKAVGKLITAKKESITKPLNEAIKSARAFFSPVEDEYYNAETIVKQKMIDFNRKEQAEADKVAKAIEKKVEAGKMTFEKASDKLDAVQPVKNVATAQGSVQFKTIKEVVIDDESKLPREYLMPDTMKIKKVALAGVAIPGVSVVEKKIVAGSSY
jgi:hypothetical protein